MRTLPTLATTAVLTLAAVATLDAQAPRRTPARDTTTARPTVDSTADSTADTTAARKPRRLLGRARALGAGVVDRVADARAGRGEGKLDRALSLAVGIGEEAVALSPTMVLGRTLLDAQRQQRASEAARPTEARADRADDRGGEDRDAAFDSLMTRYSRILARASAGDSVAVRQAERMQLEMGDVAVRVAAMPGDQAPAAYERALRAALTCAETGRGCRATARTAR